jgi:DNA-binding PadR family transcriptional regulator
MSIEGRTQRAVARGSIYVTLDRLEEKGLLVSCEGSTSAARGQRPKRIFKATPAGVRAVKSSVNVVARMQRGLRAVLGRV